MEIALKAGVAAPDDGLLIDLLTGMRSRAGADGTHGLFLEGYGYHWFRVGGLDALLKRSPV